MSDMDRQPETHGYADGAWVANGQKRQAWHLSPNCPTISEGSRKAYRSEVDRLDVCERCTGREEVRDIGRDFPRLQDGEPLEEVGDEHCPECGKRCKDVGYDGYLACPNNDCHRRVIPKP